MTTEKPSEVDPKQPPLRTFGRSRARQLSARQQRLIDISLPALAIPLTEPGVLFPLDLFEGARETWLEIGFGGGEHLTGQAARHADIGFLGCEPFVDGMAKALGQIEDEDLTNVRLFMDDARKAMIGFADQSVDRCFILFPDPWPKTRQQKRRLIQPDFLNELHRVLKAGAPVRFATDVKSYADEALARFLAHGGFDWQAETAKDWRTAPADHLTTRYESKQLGDCAPVFFDFHRR